MGESSEQGDFSALLGILFPVDQKEIKNSW